MIQRIEIQTEPHEHKKRLEDFLFDRFTGLSKMYLRDVVKSLKCEVNGEFENIGYRLRTNDFVEIELDLTREGAMRPEDIWLNIVFEDNEVIVVNKPAGMLVHPTHRDKNGTLLNALSFYLNAEHRLSIAECGLQNADSGSFGARGDFDIANNAEPENRSTIRIMRSTFVRPGLIHRLDKQTSGLIVIAKTAHAHRVLAEHFKKKLVGKRYLALVEGVVAANDGAVNAPIGRYPEQKRWDIKHDGKHAETRYLVRERSADTTLLELEPVTGRTNQLRIHCASIGHPIVGDVKRGARESERLCLHAYKLAFRHPSTGEWRSFESHRPDFAALK
ncbi:MAG TPA: RluA family pseudouridine synthase [Pyrinomonadaceae bacterium]|nr:RluA family pseudouridine synthase [Pyrinomonadaceae bacterium]